MSPTDSCTAHLGGRRRHQRRRAHQLARGGDGGDERVGGRRARDEDAARAQVDLGVDDAAPPISARLTVAMQPSPPSRRRAAAQRRRAAERRRCLPRRLDRRHEHLDRRHALTVARPPPGRRCSAVTHRCGERLLDQRAVAAAHAADAQHRRRRRRRLGAASSFSRRLGPSFIGGRSDASLGAGAAGALASERRRLARRRHRRHERLRRLVPSTVARPASRSTCAAVTPAPRERRSPARCSGRRSCRRAARRARRRRRPPPSCPSPRPPPRAPRAAVPATVARPDARSTSAAVTPATAASACSTCAEQWPQVMPPTRSTSGAGSPSATNMAVRPVERTAAMMFAVDASPSTDVRPERSTVQFETPSTAEIARSHPLASAAYHAGDVQAGARHWSRAYFAAGEEFARQPHTWSSRRELRAAAATPNLLAVAPASRWTALSSRRPISTEQWCASCRPSASPSRCPSPASPAHCRPPFVGKWLGHASFVPGTTMVIPFQLITCGLFDDSLPNLLLGVPVLVYTGSILHAVGRRRARALPRRRQRADGVPELAVDDRAVRALPRRALPLRAARRRERRARRARRRAAPAGAARAAAAGRRRAVAGRCSPHAPALQLAAARRCSWSRTRAPDELLFAVHGLFVGWLYLRYYQPQPSGAWGDASDAFAFAALFPPAVQPPLRARPRRLRRRLRLRLLPALGLGAADRRGRGRRAPQRRRARPARLGARAHAAGGDDARPRGRRAAKAGAPCSSGSK